MKTHLAATLALMAFAALQNKAQPTYEPYHFTTLAGGGGYSTNTEGSAVRFLTPITVVVDRTGNLYVADADNHAIRKVTPAGEVTLFAGRPGSLGSTDGRGADARFNEPSCAILDSTGNLYVADTANHTIRKVTSAGEVTTLAGLAGTRGSADGAGSAARFYSPNAVAFDTAGNIYVSDSDNHTIRKMTPFGTNWIVTTLAGSAGNFGSANGTNRAARFNFPVGLAVDSVTNVYVTDVNNHTIRKVTPVETNWVVTTIAGLAGSPGSADGTNRNARFNEPNGLALDSAGNLFVAEWANGTIRKMTPDGTNWVVTTIAGLAGSFGSADGTNRNARFNIAADVALDIMGNLYVADLANGLIRKMTLAGTNWVVTTRAGLGGNYGSTDGPGNTALFKGPSSVAVDSTGNAYVADQINHTIRKVTPTGVVTTIAGLAGYAGSANGSNNAARFEYPSGVAADNSGNVYVVETFNHTIRKITPSGSDWRVTTLAGSPDPIENGGSMDGTGNSARFSFPRGLAVDNAGNLYVADTFNNTIRKVTPAGLVTTRAGSPLQTGSADGVGATARFNNPYGIAVDAATNLYVADTLNYTIRKVSPTREVTTLAGLAGSPGSVDGIGTDARFYFPSGIAVDSSGHLYVTDSYNNTIRKLTPTGTNWLVTTLAGTADWYGAVDGTGGTARFGNPGGVAVDGAGNLYVADYYFNTIRKGVPVTALVKPSLKSGKFSFDLAGRFGLFVIIEASTDLMNWERLTTNAIPTTLDFGETQAGNSSRQFYRAVETSRFQQ